LQFFVLKNHLNPWNNGSISVTLRIMSHITKSIVMFFAMAMFILSSSHDFHSHDSLVEEHYEFQCDLCLIGELDDVETVVSSLAYTLSSTVLFQSAATFLSIHEPLFHSRAPPVNKV